MPWKQKGLKKLAQGYDLSVKKPMKGRKRKKSNTRIVSPLPNAYELEDVSYIFGFLIPVSRTLLTTFLGYKQGTMFLSQRHYSKKHVVKHQRSNGR